MSDTPELKALQGAGQSAARAALARAPVAHARPREPRNATHSERLVAVRELVPYARCVYRSGATEFGLVRKKLSEAAQAMECMQA